MPTRTVTPAAATRAVRAIRAAQPVRVAGKHHALVRLSHWFHLPLLVGLIVSGLAIYWAAPVFRHAPTAGNPRGDYLVDAGRALLPRASDPAEALAMLRFYLGVVPHALAKKPWPHPPVAGKYNALQRGAYFTMPIVGVIVVLSGWAMHHPVTLPWLERLFVNYEVARIVHFACMAILVSFMVPHVLLVVADGWDTLRSMVTGWSLRLKGEHHD